MIEQIGLCPEGERLREEFRRYRPRMNIRDHNKSWMASPEIEVYFQHKARCPKCRSAMWIIHRARVEAK